MSDKKILRKSGYMLIFASLIFIVLQVFLDLKSPEYMQEITLLVQTEGSEMADIWLAGGKMLLCCLGSLAASIMTAIFSARLAADFGADLRERVYDKVQSFSMTEMGRFSTASLITRSTNDITQVQMLIVMGLQVLIKAPITAVWAIIKISDSAWQWTLSTAVAVVILLAVVLLCILIATPKFKKLQKLTDDINRVTRENLTGIKVVRAYNAEDYQENKFQKVNGDLTKTNLFANCTMAFLMPSIQLIMNGISLAIYWIGAYIINAAGAGEKLTLFSEMVTFSSYAMQIIMAFMMLVMIFILLPRALTSVKRIKEVLKTSLSVTDGKGVSDNGVRGEIEFKNVSFHYPDAAADAIENISFTAHKGETVAIIGATGSGKSTVINLIPRFYDATEGEILVDGENVKNYTQSALREKIGYISQKATLFSGDIKSNVGYGIEEISDGEVLSALDTAQAGDFVAGLGDGVKSYVAQGGTNYSGGQKQRLSIARAIIRKPEILIFDDSFSALDYATDKKLRTALKRDCRDSTKIIVAQRIGTIRDADKIIVLEDGKIAGIGKHEYLMQNSEVYRQIAYSQLSKEEV